MTWKHKIEQVKRGNKLIPFYTVTYWDSDEPNTQHHNTIPEAVKKLAYPDD
jgi:hypothetical protein|tara:strand:+ start:1832 stop:1984 length:153 start_codon:yes stop_codon:yes gene_type:complete